MTPFLMVENWLKQKFEIRLANLLLNGSREKISAIQNQESA